MGNDWNELARLTAGSPFVVERVRLTESGIAIEGQFQLPPLARLTAEEHEFVVAFLRSGGNLRAMEREFGISYPTVKNRLDRIAGQLGPVDLEAPPARSDVLGLLERGDISVGEALGRLSASDGGDDS